MKRIFLLVSIALISIASTAQPFSPQIRGKKQINALAKDGGMNVMAIDTLSQYFDRSTFYDLYYLDGGYAFGPGVLVYGGTPYSVTTASGCHYDGVGLATVKEVLLYCGAKEIVGNPDTIHINVYNIANDTTPSTLLGSQAIRTSDLDSSGFWTSITGLNANITSSFLVTVEYGGIDDTFGLYSNSADTTLHAGFGDGLGEGRSRLKATADFGGKWVQANQFYLGNLDADVFLIPIVDITDGVNEFKNDLFSLKPLSPVPSAGIVSLEYKLTKPTTVSYAVMDLRGKTILKSNPEIKSAADYKETINMSSFAAGKYFVTFNAGTKTLTQQMIIAK